MLKVKGNARLKVADWIWKRLKLTCCANCSLEQIFNKVAVLASLINFRMFSLASVTTSVTWSYRKLLEPNQQYFVCLRATFDIFKLFISTRNLISRSKIIIGCRRLHHFVNALRASKTSAKRFQFLNFTFLSTLHNSSSIYNADFVGNLGFGKKKIVVCFFRLRLYLT